MTPATFSSRFNIILASASPRRKQLLEDLGLRFSIRLQPVDESYPSDLTEGNIPAYLSRKKAEPFLKDLRERDLLITADTIVWLDGEVMNKPADRADAIRMLGRLQGRTHEVFSGVTLSTVNEQNTLVVRSEVLFHSLSPEQIELYVDLCKPFDKAGAYGAQEFLEAGLNVCSLREQEFVRRIGSSALEMDCFPPKNEKIPFAGVKSVTGSYFNVMGLPLHECWEAMQQLRAT